MTTLDELVAQRHARRGNKTGNKQMACSRSAHSQFIANNFEVVERFRAYLFHPYQNPIFTFARTAQTLTAYFEKIGHNIVVADKAFDDSHNDALQAI